MKDMSKYTNYSNLILIYVYLNRTLDKFRKLKIIINYIC